MRFKSLIFAASLFIALLLLYPLSSSAEPLRIWVMHNEPVEAHGPITAERVQHGIERWRAQGIIIENSVQNLMVPAETKNPLAAYIVGRNGFLEELARFHRNEATNEPIAIEFIRWDDAYSRISSALKSGDTHTAPDVVQAGHSWILEMANDDRVADLSGHIGLNGFSPSSLADNRASLHGDLYAIPWFREMRLLYYNKMMVKSPSDLATWEGFLDASRSFNDEGGKRFLAFPITVTWNLLHNLAPWLWASGGDIVRAGKLGPFEIYRVAIDSPESARALLYLKELADSGSVDFPAVSQEVVDREFRDGKYAAIISGPWITKLLGDGWASRFGVAPIPAGPKGSFPFVGGSHLMVSEASRARGNFERAAAIVRHLTSEDAQLRFAAATGLYPVNRAALDKVLGSTGDGLFRNAVETGLKYPAMPDWGKIVENEFIRNHVWQIWRELAQGASGDTLVQTVAHAAGDLRKQIVISFAARYAPAMGLALGSIAFLGASFILVLRRRYRFTRWQCEEKERELKMTLAERTILESRAIVLERRYDDDSLELAGLRGELGSIQDKVAQLTSELAKAAAKHRSWDRNRIGEFSVRSDGTLIMGAEEVKFEHSRQARRLIDHLARQACSGSAEVHCLWGYPLFGWEAGKIQTEPRRLFETVAAKINGRLKVMGKPPLVERAGKRSSSWKLFWDKDSFVERSDVRRSQLEYENARDRFSNKEIKGACAH
ncbi:MAG: extracellular solute-binding protein, partial [bacterium]